MVTAKSASPVVLGMEIRYRQRLTESVSFDPSLDPLLEKIYATRGVHSQQQLDRSLACLPPPSSLSGIAEALDRLITALELNQQIVIVGDFDADGATSTALMMLALSAMGFNKVKFLVPNRFDYGYGLTPEIVDLALQYKPDVIVTVDNGISSIDGVAYAANFAIDVIVTDHHLPGKELPQAYAVVNPNQPGCQFPAKNLAGVGVAFYCLSGLRAELRSRGWFEARGISEPNMASWLDLVALGTVADVVPLDQVNRALVHQGLQRIRSGLCRPGIKALLQIAGKLPDRILASDLGFALGPRLNAAGRLDDISLGINCLITEDSHQAMSIATTLDQLNRDRKSIEQGMQREAHSVLDQLLVESEQQLPTALCLFDASWHQGVVGLVASRLKEKYHRPTVVFARAENGELKGSSRSIPGLHIRDVMEAVASQNPGLITKFGGHAMAAGLTLDEDKLDGFIQAFQAQVEREISADDLKALILSDGSLEPHHFSLHMAELLQEAGPWGQQFPEPLFDGKFMVKKQRIVGEKHLKLVLSCPSQPDLILDAIHFNMDAEQWPNPQCKIAHCVYQLDINEFRGQRNLQLLVRHIESTVDDRSAHD